MQWLYAIIILLIAGFLALVVWQNFFFAPLHDPARNRRRQENAPTDRHGAEYTASSLTASAATNNALLGFVAGGTGCTRGDNAQDGTAGDSGCDSGGGD